MNNKLTFLTTSLSVVAGCNMALAQSRPNIVVIVTDDQNKNSISCYDETVDRTIKTPNINSIAENGIKFNNANVVTTVSSPSRYSILTGRYYSSNSGDYFMNQYPEGVQSCIANDCFIEKEDNLPSKLQEVGYTTGFVGKFHLANHELLNTSRNWERNGLNGYDKDSDPRTDAETNRKMQENHEWWRNRIGEFGFDYVNGVYSANLRELFNEASNAHNVEWSVDAALKFLNEQEGSENPFMLYFATTYDHGPAAAQVVKGKMKYSLDADPTLTGEGVREDLKENAAARAALRSENPKMTPKALTSLWWDNAVGELLQKLEDMGVADNTIILYISDHGNQNGCKSTLYNDATCIPMLMQWKAGMAQGVEYDHVIGSIDIAPTLMEVAGVDKSKYNADGVSMTRIFKSPKKRVRDVLLMEMGYAKAVKTDDYTYIALRYPEKPETAIDKKSGKRYIMKHAQLARWSAESHPNYFELDQLYDYNADPLTMHNIFGENKKLDKKYQKLMKKECNRYAARVFGEFVEE